MTHLQPQTCVCPHCRTAAAQTDHEGIVAAADRLAMLIQNLHHLMGFTTVRKFEACTHQLFRRYITACGLMADAARARSAWRALERTGSVHMLQDVNLNMVYIDTLLRASRTARPPQRAEFLDAAMQCAAAPPSPLV